MEERFAFLEDETLRSNVVIAFRYIIFLLTLKEKLKFRGAIAYSIYKDIILHVGSIVESCIHYTIQKYLDAGVIKKENIMPVKWQDVLCKDVYKISDDKKVCGVIKEKVYENFSKKTQFLIINRIAKKSGIITDGLFKRAQSLKDKRNKVHLAGLEETDDYYGKADINTAFKTANLILTHLEIKLNELKLSNTSQTS